MVYQYFLGIADEVSLKVRYRELAKTLHPDKATGDHSSFVAMKAEFDHIIYVNPPYPIVNIARRGTFTNTTIQSEEVISKLSPEELNRRKAEAFFNQVRDEYFDTIDQVLEMKGNKSNMWVLSQISKLDDISLNHFKYLCYKLGFDQSKAKTIYSNYVNIKSGLRV